MRGSFRQSAKRTWSAKPSWIGWRWKRTGGRKITSSMAPLTAMKRLRPASKRFRADYVVLNFWVSAKKPGEGQSEHLAQLIAERLKALLTNPDTRYELSERGICHVQPQGPPQPLPNPDYAKRLVGCNAQINYYLE